MGTTAGGRIVAACVAACFATGAGVAHAADPAPGTPGWLLESLRNRVYVEGRGADQATNPAYLKRSLPDAIAYLAGTDTESVTFDPFRKDWGSTRGVVREISYRNRYGAKIRGHLYAPRRPLRDAVTAKRVRGPLPAVIMLSGLGGYDTLYQGIDQSLAESGYVVMSFDPQGQGASDFEPAKRYCDPDGRWRRRQEAGQREQGECAGVYPRLPSVGALAPVTDVLYPTPAGGVAFTIESAEFIVREHLGDDPFDSGPFYRATGPNFVLGALDAVEWLRSKRNPWRNRIDLGRVGLMGHSLGAYGSMIAGNRDPKHRFDAAVGFDGYGPPEAVRPRIPTMFHLAESEEISGPRLAQPGPYDHPSAPIGRDFRRAGVDTMQVGLRGSSHQEWYYLPFQLANPVQGVPISASSEGERVSLYYTLAWFDRYLKGKRVKGEPGAAALAQRRDASRRLAAPVFDDSADRSSIGTGRGGSNGNNVPYTIAGERAESHLSRYIPSRYAFGRRSCRDMRAGC